MIFHYDYIDNFIVENGTKSTLIPFFPKNCNFNDFFCVVWKLSYAMMSYIDSTSSELLERQTSFSLKIITKLLSYCQERMWTKQNIKHLILRMPPVLLMIF